MRQKTMRERERGKVENEGSWQKGSMFDVRSIKRKHIKTQKEREGLYPALSWGTRLVRTAE